MNRELRYPIEQVVQFLVAGKFAELETLTQGARLTAKEMETAVADYGRKLVPLPEEAFGRMNVVEVRDAQPRRWSIALPLWTQEGRSDLTLEMTVTDGQNGYLVELDDIHVL